METTGFVGGGCLGEESSVHWPLVVEMVQKPQGQIGFICHQIGLLNVFQGTLFSDSCLPKGGLLHQKHLTLASHPFRLSVLVLGEVHKHIRRPRAQCAAPDRQWLANKLKSALIHKKLTKLG